MRHTPLIEVILFSFFLNANAQCLMYEVPLNTRTQNSSFIFEGKVISKKSFWNSEHTLIYTSNLVEVYKIFKGNLSAEKVEVVTEGGVVEDQINVAHPALQLKLGNVGVFFAQPTQPLISQKNNTVRLEPYANAQGFIKYNFADKTAADPFKIYQNVKKDVYGAIAIQAKQPYKELKSFDINKTGNSSGLRTTPTISSISPTTITAGTRSELTIDGNNFGSSFSANSDIQFKNADDGGSTYISLRGSSSYPSIYIVSWSNTQIKVLVISGAGTGTVKVTNDLGETSAASSQSLTVTYNITNLDDGTVDTIAADLVSDNGNGGYNWTLNQRFADSTGALARFRDAMNTWRCGTDINWIINSSTTSSSCNANDTTNLVTYDNDCALSPGVLGTGYSYFSGCSSGGKWYWRLSGVDIKFDASPTYTWYYGEDSSAIPGNQGDFQTVALHELGHCHQQGHIINSGKVMHYATTIGTTERLLDDNIDIAGGNYIVNRSSTSNPCGSSAHIDVNDTITWTGSVSTTWKDANNWSPKFIPRDCNILVIPNVANDPIISTNDAECWQIEIQSGSGGIVTISSGGVLNVKKQ